MEARHELTPNVLMRYRRDHVRHKVQTPPCHAIIYKLVGCSFYLVLYPHPLVVATHSLTHITTTTAMPPKPVSTAQKAPASTAGKEPAKSTEGAKAAKKLVLYDFGFDHF